MKKRANNTIVDRSIIGAGIAASACPGEKQIIKEMSLIVKSVKGKKSEDKKNGKAKVFSGVYKDVLLNFQTLKHFNFQYSGIRLLVEAALLLSN